MLLSQVIDRSANVVPGLHEYLYWCEDMGLEPVLAIYAGYSLDGTAITGDALQPYVQEVLNELEVSCWPASVLIPFTCS